MRTRALSLLSLLAIPVVLQGQILRLPRIGRRPTPPPAPLPPTGGPIAQTLEYHSSRWSGEGYGMMSNVRIPSGAGVLNYGTFSAGSRGGYRFADRFTGTVDLTTSLFGSPVDLQTAEVGGRFSPMPFNPQIRPFVDLRASYLRVLDAYAVPDQLDYEQTSRYSRGFGGITGVGFEYSLTNAVALSTEVSALRARMTNYSADTPSSIPSANDYWMTSFRLAVGLKYSAGRVLNIKQKPH
jgi:hypothetical protein